MSNEQPKIIVANKEMNEAIDELRTLRKQMKILEVKEKALKEKICSFMGERQELVDADGLVAITWAEVKDSVRLDSETVKLIYPEVYYGCLATIPGGRRFVVK
jgi:predicted phage-related endonuclease